MPRYRVATDADIPWGLVGEAARDWRSMVGFYPLILLLIFAV